MLGSKLMQWWEMDKTFTYSPLIRHYGREIVTQFGSSIDAKLESLMENGEWSWPTGKSKEPKSGRFNLSSPYRMQATTSGAGFI